MKKLLWILSSFAVLLIFQSAIMKKDGAAPGYTGSPGDSFKNCTACHGGTAINVDNWITSDIPSDGFVPGVTYTIRAINREAGATRFGFEISPQDSIGNLLGTMALIDAVKTKFVGNEKYITYTENGVEGVDSLSWTFKWTAPQANEVVFYGGFNSNFDGHKGGDQTFLSTLKVKRNGFSGINNISKIQAVKIYPNPTCDYVQINFEVQSAGNVVLDIIDMNGKRVSLLMDALVNSGTFNQKFNINNLAEGNYIVRINANGKASTQRISIRR